MSGGHLLDTPALLLDLDRLEANAAYPPGSRPWRLPGRFHIYGGRTAEERLDFIPNHACTVENNFDQIHILRNGDVVDKCPVAARGRLQ